MMKATVSVFIFALASWHLCGAPPVSKNKEEQAQPEGDALELMMHYHRYLKEVVSALESDPEFKRKLEAADENDIRSGKIANELEFVSHHVRTRLDEIKRTELNRLRELIRQQEILSNNEIVDDPNHGHLDHANPHTFEIEDLKKLIAKTTADLAEADQKRREEFKQYEMQKEFEKQDKLNQTNGDEKEKLEKHYQELEEKHKKHQPLHEPGHKAQLEEVWEEQDHMQQEFDPKTFFMLHDLDSNGRWDQDEVKALFIKELDKMYAAGAPEDDMRERMEEMERMRETVFQEVDTNKDGFIDYYEFLMQTKKQDFQQDNGWKGLDEQKPFTDEELQEYIRRQQMMQPPPGYMHPGGHYPPGAYPNQGYHPNQVPQDHHQGYPPNQGYPAPQQYQGQPQQFQGQHQQFQGQHQQFQGQHQQFQGQGYQPQGYPQQGQPQFQDHPQAGNPSLNTNEVYPNQQFQQNPGQVPIGHEPPNYPPSPNQGHFNPNQGQVNLNQGQLNQNQGQLNRNQLNQNQGQLNQNPGKVNQQQEQIDSNQVNQKQDQINPNQHQVNPNQGQANPNQAPANPNQAQVNPNQGQANPNKAQLNQNQEQANQLNSDQAQVNKNSGQQTGGQPQAQRF